MSLLFGRRGSVGKSRIVLVTDPGPDPDDIKSLLIASMLHKRGVLELRCVVTNGGEQAAKRAALARCLLDHVDVPDVPVGVGSAGKPYAAQPHEYELAGFEAVDAGRLPEGHELLLRTLRAAPRRSLTVVCISSLRDLAAVIDEAPALVLERVQDVVVQGGLEREAVAEEGADEAAEGAGTDARPFRWKPDSSVNNMFDPAAAETVYAFCLQHGLPLAVISRNAVPLLPMQLAKSFADRTDCPVMRYLANAQFLGLEGLWQKLCQRKLPARCTKQWYFETFCGMDRDEFELNRFDELDESAAIKQYLNGFVKPYDVLALMAAMPHTRGLFGPGVPVSGVAEVPAGGAGSLARGVGPLEQSGGRRVPGAPSAHRLLLRADDMIDVRHVLRLLRDTYHEVVISTREHLPTGGGDDDGLAPAAEAGAPEADASGHGGGGARAADSRNSSGDFAQMRRKPRMSAERPQLIGSSGPRLADGSSPTTHSRFARAEASRSNGASPLTGRLRASGGALQHGHAEPSSASKGGGASPLSSRLRSSALLQHSTDPSSASPPHSPSRQSSGAGPHWSPEQPKPGKRSRVSPFGPSAERLGAALTSSQDRVHGRFSSASSADDASADATDARRAPGADHVLLPKAPPEVDASGAFPASFLADGAKADDAKGYFARQRESNDDGAKQQPLSSASAVATGALIGGVLSRDAAVQLLERALRQADAHSVVISTALGLAGAAICLLVTFASVGEDVGAALSRGVPLGAARLADRALQLRLHAYTIVRIFSIVISLLGVRPLRPFAVRVRVLAYGFVAEQLLLAAHRGASGASLLLLHAPAERAAASGGGFVEQGSDTAAMIDAVAAVDLAVAAVHVACALVPLAVARRVRVDAREVGSLLSTLWTALGGLSLAKAGATVVEAGYSAMLSSGGSGPPGPAGAGVLGLGLAALAAAVEVLLGGLALRPAFRTRAQALAARALPSRGAHAPLAVLIGFGTDEVREPYRLVDEALRSFTPVSLGARALAALNFDRLGLDGTPSDVGSAGGDASPASPSQRGAALRTSGSSLEGLQKSISRVSDLLHISAGRDNGGGRDSGGGGGGGGTTSLEQIGRSGSSSWEERRPSRRTPPGHGRQLGGAAAAADGSSADVNIEVLAALQANGGPGARRRQTRGSGNAGGGGGGGGSGPGGARRRADSRFDALLHAPAVALSGQAVSARDSMMLSSAPRGGRRGAGVRAKLAADYYVVHSGLDHPDERCAALREWAARWEGAHGRPPTAWIDVLCADPLLKPTHLLQHVPVYMCRCARLLILAGPTLVDRLWAITELYCWRAAGGHPDSVEIALVVPAGTSVAERQRLWGEVVGAFDAFHAMYAHAANDELTALFHQAITLATVSHFNEVVRSYMRAAQQAADADKRRLDGGIEEGDGEDEPSSDASSAHGSMRRSFAGAASSRKQRRRSSSRAASTLTDFFSSRARRASGGGAADGALPAKHALAGLSSLSESAATTAATESEETA